MKRQISLFASALALVLGSTAAQADERGNAVAGAIIGGAAGAVLGHQIDGRHGAAVGAVLGAATGASIATVDNRSSHRPAPVYRDEVERDAYIYQDDEPYYERERVVYAPPVRERVVVVQPEPVVVRPQHVIVRPSPVVVYQPVRVAYGRAGYALRDEGPRWYGGHPGKHRGHHKHRDRDDWRHHYRRHHHDD